MLSMQDPYTLNGVGRLKKLALALFLLLCSNSPAVVVEQIYCFVNEDIITQLDFEEERALARKSPESNYDYNDPVSVMSNLIVYRLIESKLSENNLAIKNSDISNYINMIVEKNNIGSIENFISILSSSQNLSYEEYKVIVRRRLIYQYFTTRLISVPPINNREIEEYYQMHRESEFRVQEPILNLSAITMILNENTGFSEKIQIQNRMLKIKGEVTSGEITFEEAVKKYSEDEVSKASEGLLGWVNPALLGIGVDVSKSLQSMAKGSVSDLIRDRQGISLYKVNDIVKEGYIPYELAILEAKNKLFGKNVQKAINRALKEMIESSVIITKNPKFKVDFNFSAMVE